MLIVFKSKSMADVLMLAEHAQPVLHAAGKIDGNPMPERGIFTAEQLGAAIAGIERTVQVSSDPPDVDEEDAVSNPEITHPMNRPVGFRQRAYPLLAMLKAAQQQGHDVMWEPAPMW